MRHSTGKWAKLPWPPAIEDVLLSCWRLPYFKAAHKDLLKITKNDSLYKCTTILWLRLGWFCSCKGVGILGASVIGHTWLLLLHSSSFIKLAGRESHPEFHTAKSFPDRWFLKPFHLFRIVLALTSLQDTPRQDRDANEYHMRTGDARRISKAVIDGVFDEKLHWGHATQVDEDHDQGWDGVLQCTDSWCHRSKAMANKHDISSGKVRVYYGKFTMVHICSYCSWENNL